MLFFAFFLSLVCNMHNTYSTEVSAVEEGFVGDALQHYHFYSYLCVFTNLLLIPSKVSTGLSDISFFFLFFSRFSVFCVVDFLKFVKSILRAVVSTFVLWFLDIVILKNQCVFFLQKKWFKMDGFKTTQTKNSLLLDVLLVVGLFQTFVFEFDVMIVVNRFFFPVTCCKPVSLKNACFGGGSESQIKFLRESLFDFSVWPHYREQTESENCTSTYKVILMVKANFSLTSYFSCLGKFTF